MISSRIYGRIRIVSQGIFDTMKFKFVLIRMTFMVSIVQVIAPSASIDQVSNN